MLTTLLRLYFTLTTALAADVVDESAHSVCELAVYAVIDPAIADDATSVAGEAWCELLCRDEPWPGLSDARISDINMALATHPL